MQNLCFNFKLEIELTISMSTIQNSHDSIMMIHTDLFSLPMEVDLRIGIDQRCIPKIFTFY